MVDWLILQQGLFIYLGIFLALMGGAIGLPIPEDLPLIACGILINQKIGNPLTIVIVAYCSILIGDILIFSIGRKLGPRLFKMAWFKKRFKNRRIRKLRLRLERKRLLTIFLARHLFYFRTLTFLLCGAIRMHPIRFIIADAIAALISTPLMVGIGYLATEHYSTILQYVKNIELIILCILCIFLGVIFYKKIKV